MNSAKNREQEILMVFDTYVKYSFDKILIFFLLVNPVAIPYAFANDLNLSRFIKRNVFDLIKAHFYRQILANESYLKTMKNAFHFSLTLFRMGGGPPTSFSPPTLQKVGISPH